MPNSRQNTTEDEPPNPRPFPIVAIGASAGGVDAFRRLLRSLAPDTGMAFIVIQHLDPRQPSRLAEVLGQVSTMPVVEIEEGTRLAADHIYVAPPAVELALTDDTFHVSPVPDDRVRGGSIDLMFQSLVDSHGSKTIGVLLSGAGSDGLEGLRAIQIAGGITFAQDAASARVASMPASALAAGVVDTAATPESIAEALAQLPGHPYLARVDIPLGESTVDNALSLRRILSRVLEETGVDLTEYKPATIERRLARRMALRRVSKLEEYQGLVESDHGEARLLLEDVLIHVTHFYRDPEIYQALRHNVFPAMVASRPAGSPIRIWVAGCSSGEEVYSIAMELVEYLAEIGRDHPIEIFGSDLSEAAIEHARAGFYSESRMTDVSPARRDRFFARSGGGFRIEKLIRDLCVFARHDVARDPPFSKIDLVSCRNTLIYFGTSLQQRVLRNIHYSLVRGGFLVLGASESVTAAAKLFVAFDQLNKIFMPSTLPAQMSVGPRQTQARRDPVEVMPRRSFDALLTRQVDALVARYAPPGIVVNARGEILLFRGRSVPYVEPSTGQPTTSVFRMARGGLAAELRAALKQAAETMVTVRREGLTIRAETDVRSFDLEIAPIPGHLLDSPEPCFLILFMEMVPTGHAHDRSARVRSPATDQDRLEHELASTKVYLQSLLDEQQRTADELGATNEELVSTNEELQSTNEEIESAKEELQSTNEELTTLNDELRSRNDELSQVNDDLVNLIGSIDIPIVILSHDRKIRRFTPRAQRLMNLLPSDVGRPFEDIRFNLPTSDIEMHIAQVLASNTAVEVEVQDRDLKWCRLQIRPYRTSDNRIDGVVMSLLDIDSLKSAVRSAEQSGAYSLGIVEAVPTPLLVLDENLRVITANHAFHLAYGLSGPVTLGQSFEVLAHGAWNLPELTARLHGVFVGDRVDGVIVERDIPPLGTRVMELFADPIEWRGGARCVLVAIQDITARTSAERERATLLAHAEAARALAEHAQADAERANAAKDVFLATLSHELRTPLTTILLNTERLRDPTGLTPERVTRGIEVIERAARAQAQLIEDLLDVSSVIAGKLKLKADPIDISALVAQTAESMRATAERRRIRLEVTVPAALGTVVGDALRLQQVVWNLLTNAIKFTPESGQVAIDLSVSAGRAVLRVTDSGKGIARSSLEAVFGLFSQEDGDTNRQHGGLGLGLAIVRHLVDAHGGKVSADSPGVGEGATFTVELPLASSKVSAVEASGPTTSEDITGIHVLVVEDDEPTRILVGEILTGMGATVRTAGSVDDGLSEVRDHAPDVIVCDIAMPGRDGFDFIAALRALPLLGASRLPVVAVTALASEGDREFILAAGFNDHLAKPIDTRRLAAVLSQWRRPGPLSDGMR